MGPADDDDLDDLVKRQLKHWCLSGLVTGLRSEHMDPALFPRITPLKSLPTLEELDARLATEASKRG